MKVLILANHDLGLYRFRKELITNLIQRGNQVYISVPNGEYIPNLKNLGCVFINTPVDRRGINPQTDFLLFKRYVNIIKKIKPDFIITYTIKPNIYGGIVASFHKKKYAINITGLGTAFENKGIIRTIVIFLYKIALKKAKVVFVENSSIRYEILKYKLCKDSKIKVLNGAGVNTSEFAYLSYPENKNTRFLFIGRVMKEKGIEELLYATRRLFKEGFKCILDIVGPFEDDYKRIIADFEKEGWLKYYGFQDDVRPFIAQCDCFVLPSYHEGMANTNLECASCGRPVITSNIPGCREAIINKTTGFLCKSRDKYSLYKTMKCFLKLSRDERIQMGCAGREHISKKFEKNKVVETTLNAIWQ